MSRSACLAVLVVAGAVAGCSRTDNGPSTTAAALAQATEVVTAATRTEPLGTRVEAVGTARANESINVTSKTSNIVTAIAFREDSLVRAGQVLVELDGAEARASLAEAEAALIDSESQSKRSRSLYAQQALSVSQLDQIEATLKASKARVDAARARLADTVIRAGFDGRTGLRQVSVGSLVNAGTVITTLDDASIIKLEFTVPETHLYLLRRGQAVSARSAGLPNARFTGTITTLDSRIDPATRSITVRAEIPNADGALRPGMFMTVLLEGDAAPALLVPEAAIVPEQGHTYVFVAIGGKVERREVRTGRRRLGEVEVLSGLSGGERVVTEGTQMLRDGDKVREAARAAAPGAAPAAGA
jgi:membrane fusion protein, multidrug efflux system